jgi:hypothetical protein
LKSGSPLSSHLQYFSSFLARLSSQLSAIPIAHGRRANAPLIAAVALGDSTALVVPLLGLGALLTTSGSLPYSAGIEGSYYQHSFSR